MLYHEFDIINERLKERFISEGIYDEVVIDWWSYEDPVHLFNDRADGVNNIFHSVIKPDTGYYHWAIPTENNENIRACALLAKKLSEREDICQSDREQMLFLMSVLEIFFSEIQKKTTIRIRGITDISQYST